MKIKGIAFAFATVSVAALPGLSHAQWTATVIHPNGYEGSAAGGMSSGQILGWSFPPGQGQFQAGYWTSPSPAAFTSLHQASWYESSANVSDGTHQYGYIRPDLATGYQAAMWSGTAASYTSYHPDGYKQSAINSLLGTQLAGWVMGNDDKHHGVIWDGSGKNSFIDLNPGGQDESLVYGMDGTTQVGHTGSGFAPQAALWTGTAASWVNLNFAALEQSDAYVTRDGWQAGWGLYNGDTRPVAMMWHGSAASAVNLNPNGAVTSALNDTNGGWQVGDANFDPDIFHAGLWHGTADSFEDLHSYLSANFVMSSAISIDFQPDAINIYGFGIDDAGKYQAVVWSKPVPEPASMAALGIGVVGLLRKRRAAKRTR